MNEVLKFSYNIKNKFIEGHIKNDMRFLNSAKINPTEIMNFKEKAMDINFLKKIDSTMQKLGNKNGEKPFNNSRIVPNSPVKMRSNPSKEISFS